MATVTEVHTEVKPARIGYFTIRGSRERNPLGYRCVGVNLAVAVAVEVLRRHGSSLPKKMLRRQVFFTAGSAGSNRRQTR